MRHKIYLILLCTFASAGTVAGQTCPGPAVRTALLNLQRANTTLTTNTVTGPRAGQFGLTDSCGNQRYQYYVRVLDSAECICCNPFTTPVVGAPASAFVKICGTDSLFYFDWKREPLFLGESLTITQILDSLQTDTSFFNNWYTRNDTTTDILRTAYILRSAEWVGIDPTGFVRLIMGDVANSLLYADADEANIAHLDPSGQSIVKTNTSGVEIFTSQTASRAVNIRTDTVNTSGSFDPTNFRLNFNSDNSYLYADSLKVVGLGQFPAFPAVLFDGREKGFYYDPASEGVLLVNGNGTTGANSFIYTGADLIQNASYFDANLTDFARIDVNAQNNASTFVQNQTKSTVSRYAQLTQKIESGTNDLFTVYQETKDTNVSAINYMGRGAGSPLYTGARAWGTRTFEGATPFDWIQTYLPNDTTTQTVSFYNRSYYFPNARPSNTLNDTSVIVWIGDGTNAGKHPQFVPLPGGGSTVNWYNANGTTTDNSRIADVLETATWRSADVTQDGVVPFRWELAGGPTNEPEIMVWAFPNGDSLLLYQADQEIVFNSNNPTVFRSDLSTSLNAPTTSLSNNVGGTFTLNVDGTLSHSAQSLQYNLSNGSTGKSAVELLLTGPSTPITLSANQTLNFRISLRARCTNVGNGVGISSGNSYASWVNGCIKRVGTTTSIVGSVQTPTTAQADTGMSTAVTTVDADDTDDSLRVKFTPPSTAGTTTVIAITATVEITQ